MIKKVFNFIYRERLFLIMTHICFFKNRNVLILFTFEVSYRLLHRDTIKPVHTISKYVDFYYGNAPHR